MDAQASTDERQISQMMNATVTSFRQTDMIDMHGNSSSRFPLASMPHSDPFETEVDQSYLSQ